MDTPHRACAAARTDHLRPVAGRVTSASLIGLGTAFGWTFWLDHQLYSVPVWPVLVLGVVAFAAAGLVASGVRWAHPVGAAVGAGVLGTAFLEPFVIMRLIAPETLWTFTATVLIVAFAALAALSGLAATVLGRAAISRPAPPARPSSPAPGRR